MGIEYTSSTISDPSVDLAEIWGILAGENSYVEIVSSTSEKVAFRFLEEPERSTWKEDATLYYEKSKIIVTFHTGTKQQRADLLLKIKRPLEDRGVLIEFTEE